MTRQPCHTKASRLRDAPPVLAAPVAPQPGHCACGMRLSVANVNGICDACADEKARAVRLGLRQPGQWCKCGRGRVTNRYCCNFCNAEYAARAKARRQAEQRRMEW